MIKYTLLIASLFIGLVIYAQNNGGENPINERNFRKQPVFNQQIDPLKPNYAILNACMLFAINEERVKHRLPALDWHIALETSAYFHSKAMADYKFFSHYNMLDSNRLSAESRGLLAGIKNPLMGECIAQSSFTKPSYLGMCDVFIDLWMHSAPHKKIILSENANAIGVGFYFNDKMDLYATMDVQTYRILVFDSSKAVDKLPFLSWFQKASE